MSFLGPALPCVMLLTVVVFPLLGLFLFVPLYAGVQVVGIWRRAWDSVPSTRRWVLVSAFAFASTWAGLEWNSTQYSELSKAEKNEWDLRYPSRVTGDVPSAVFGFPLQVVAGRGNGAWYFERKIFIADTGWGGPRRVRMRHGLWGLWLNFCLLGGFAWIMVRFIPDRFLPHAHMLAVGLVFASVWLAHAWLRGR